MKYYRVKYGFSHDEFISVDETELPMAMRAHITGKKGVFKEGAVSGDKIIAIVPDWQRIMGWNRDYNLMGEDYQEIAPMREEYELLLETTKHQITGSETPRLE